MKKLEQPDQVLAFLAKRYANQHQAWLAGDGAWPLTVSLGMPHEADVLKHMPAIVAWVGAWRSWKKGGQLQWETRRFARAGEQSFPAQLVFTTPDEVADIVGEGRRWRRAAARYARVAATWPQLAGTSALTGRFAALADYSDEDFDRLCELLAWLDANPASGLYLRQLPVEGMDTKWFEQRKNVVSPLLRVLRGAPADTDFHTLCGLARPAHRLRMRVLCPTLRAAIGGLHDVEAPLHELAALPLRPRAVVVVENLETGLALPPMPGAVAFMRLGNAVPVLAQVPWLAGADVVYWGDLDTHGFAILARAREALPHARSVLMDEATLLGHRGQWVSEAVQCSNAPVEWLTQAERAVYEQLLGQTWGAGVRLEQERVPMRTALPALERAIGAGAVH